MHIDDSKEANKQAGKEWPSRGQTASLVQGLCLEGSLGQENLGAFCASQVG